MGYTKKNLREVADSAAQHGLSEHQEARFPARDLQAEQTGCASTTEQGAPHHN